MTPFFPGYISTRKNLKSKGLEYSDPMKSMKSESESIICSVESDSLWPHGLYPTRLLCPWASPGKNTGVGSHSLLQGIFLTQGLNPGLLHCMQSLYHLSHQGRPVNSIKWLWIRNYQKKEVSEKTILPQIHVPSNILYPKRDIFPSLRQLPVCLGLEFAFPE